MVGKAILDLRLKNQLLIAGSFHSPHDIIHQFGAVQAQDVNMAKWAIGIRQPIPNLNEVNNEIDSGRILRTHILRPTWHFVSAQDIYWMLDLSAPQIKMANRSRNKELGLDLLILNQCFHVLEKVLLANKQLTRKQLIVELGNAGIRTDENRASHIFMEAEVEKLLCSGPQLNGNQTFALLSERVPKKIILSKEESLAKLARKYFASHGPATLNDFLWYSGLRVADARQALESIKDNMIPEVMNNETYWFIESEKTNQFIENHVVLLPAYDQFLIGFKYRDASITLENSKKTISTNGLFRPIIVINGEVVGVWRKVPKQNKPELETEYFRKVTKIERKLVNIEFEKYCKFHEF